MITVGVGELKPNFSDILNEIRDGEEVLINYGRRKEKVAVIVPYQKYCKRNLKTSAKLETAIPDGNHELDSFIGTWIKDPEFDKVLATFEKVDQELWK